MKEFKNLLKEKIGENAYNNYFARAVLQKTESELIYSGANVFMQKFVYTNFKEVLEELSAQLFGKKLTLSAQKTEEKKSFAAPVKRQKNALNPALNFDAFIVGESNSYAFSICKQICDLNKFGRLFNPIFIYSATGLGKTHLLHATGQECAALGKNVIFKNSQTFKNDFLSAQQSGNWQRFNEQFEDCELLLIDDVQFLANTESMQREFFHIFNEIVANGGQVLITSDMAPKDLDGIEERLKSRFAYGVIANITPPDLETKQAILRKKCELFDVNLDKKIIDYIANYIGKNVRDITGMITSINAWQQYTGMQVDMEQAKKFIAEYVSEQASVIEMEDILSAVSDALSIKIAEITSANKSKTAVLARRVVIFLAKELLQNPVGQIATSLKMKTHSNVSHHLRTINELLIKDQEFYNLCESIKNKLINKN